MSKYIDIKLLEKRSAVGVVKAFIDEHLKDKACSIATMRLDIVFHYGFEIGRSNLHKILMDLLDELVVQRKKVGNTFYYYSKEFVTR